MPRWALRDGIADESTGPRAGFAAGAQRRHDPSVRDPLGRPVPSVADVILYLLGIAGVAAGITLLFLGMRAVMDVGGMCAEGGPNGPVPLRRHVASWHAIHARSLPRNSQPSSLATPMSRVRERTP